MVLLVTPDEYPANTLIAIAPGIQFTVFQYGYFNYQTGIGLKYSPATKLFFIDYTGDIGLGIYLPKRRIKAVPEDFQ
jgi:hypothetical protein